MESSGIPVTSRFQQAVRQHVKNSDAAAPSIGGVQMLLILRKAAGGNRFDSFLRNGAESLLYTEHVIVHIEDSHFVAQFVAQIAERIIGRCQISRPAVQVQHGAMNEQAALHIRFVDLDVVRALITCAQVLRTENEESLMHMRFLSAVGMRSAACMFHYLNPFVKPPLNGKYGDRTSAVIGAV